MSQLTLEFLAQQANLEAPYVPDDRQGEFTRELLTPFLDLIEQDLLRLRAQFDEEFLRANPARAQRYPLGRCREICTGVLKLLQGELMAAETPGVQALGEFCAVGGMIKHVWGNLRHSYFQNALQVGDLYVDVANDTVVTTKPKVEILPFAQAQFFALKNYSDYARLAETYWRAQAYPNRYLPALAPLYPLLLVYPSGNIKLHSPYQTLFYRNLVENFQLADDVLFNSEISGRRLPATAVQQLSAVAKAVGLQQNLVANALGDAHLRQVLNAARETTLRLDATRCQDIINMAQRFSTAASPQLRAGVVTV